MDRRSFIAGCAALSLTAKAGDAFGLSGPLTRIIFPFAAGGGGDALCRVVAQHLGPSLDRSVIVENRTGGDGLIGIKSVKGAAPDGSTILVTTGPTMYLLPMTEVTPSFDPPKDFVPVSLLARFEFAVVASPAINVTDFQQFVAWLKANPDKATFGVPSNGTIPHFIGSKLEQVLGIPMTRVAYRGSAPIVNDLLGGHLPFGITTVADVAAQHRAGGVKISRGDQRCAFAVSARRADLERQRRRSGCRCLVRHVAAGRQSAGVRPAIERRCCRSARQARGKGKAAGDRVDPGRHDTGRS